MAKAASTQRSEFLGLRTVIYKVDDLAKAKKWYTEAFGVAPYFDQPFYVGFNIGGYELGLDPDSKKTRRGDNAIAYWGVPDAALTVARLTAAGAKANTAVQEVGEGIKVATLADPFGNILGIIENPHFQLPPAPAAPKR